MKTNGYKTYSLAKPVVLAATTALTLALCAFLCACSPSSSSSSTATNTSSSSASKNASTDSTANSSSSSSAAAKNNANTPSSNSNRSSMGKYEFVSSDSRGEHYYNSADGTSLYKNNDGSIEVTDGYGTVLRDKNGDGTYDTGSTDGGKTWVDVSGMGYRWK